MVRKQTGTFKSFDETEIYYELHGSGKPILFVYGLVCQMNHWIKQIEYFSKTYQVVLFDYRGHHKSETPKDYKQLSLTSLAQDIKHLCDHLSLPPLPLIGHSMGVRLVVKTYELFPELFSHLVLLNGYVTNPLSGLLGFKGAQDFLEKLEITAEKYPEVAQKLWSAALLNPLTIPLTALAGGFNLSLTQKKDIEVYVKGVSLVHFSVFIRLLKDMMSFDGRNICSQISQPALLISGNRDSVTPSIYQIEMHKLIKNSQLIQIPYGSHCTQLDYPEFVNSRIEEFLENHTHTHGL